MMEKYLENNANRDLIETLNKEIEQIALETFGQARVPSRAEIAQASEKVMLLTSTREMLYWMGRGPVNANRWAAN